MDYNYYQDDEISFTMNQSSYIALCADDDNDSDDTCYGSKELTREDPPLANCQVI